MTNKPLKTNKKLKKTQTRLNKQTKNKGKKANKPDQVDTGLWEKEQEKGRLSIEDRRKMPKTRGRR